MAVIDNFYLITFVYINNIDFFEKKQSILKFKMQKKKTNFSFSVLIANTDASIDVAWQNEGKQLPWSRSYVNEKKKNIFYFELNYTFYYYYFK